MKLLDVKIDNVSMKESVDMITNWINHTQTETRIVTTPNPEMIVAAQNDELLKGIINQSDLSIADGGGVKLILRLLKNIRLKEKVTGADLISNLARESHNSHWRWFLLGGAPGVAKKAAENLKNKFPGIEIVGAEDGGLLDRNQLDQKKTLVEQIQKSRPDILIVSFGVPKQEIFMNHFKKQLGAKVAIGAGGTLDFLSEKKIRAPKFLRLLNLEWLWRLILEPSRYKRILIAVVVFPVMALFDTRKN